MKNDLQTDRACLEKEKGMLVMKKFCRNGIILLLAGMMMLCIIPAQPVMAQEKAYIYMDTLKPVKADSIQEMRETVLYIRLGSINIQGEIQTFMEIHIRMELKRG